MPHEHLESDALTERGWLCVPCALVSRDRLALASSGVARGLVRGGALEGWRADAEGAAWVELHTGVGPAQALVRLEAPVGERLPARYRIESAPLGREGPGAWRPELTLSDSGARTRAHVIEFDGQGAIRVLFEAREERPALARFDVHDASDGTDDVWLVLGDALAGAGLSEDGGARGFAEALHAGYAGYFPALIDESRAGETPAQTLARLPDLLALHAPARRVALGFSGSAPGSLAEAPLEQLAQALLGAGRVPLFSRAAALGGSPLEVETFNARLAALERQLGLAPGPDPGEWARAWRGALGATPSASLLELPVAARDALSALWVAAADVFYVPQ